MLFKNIIRIITSYKFSLLQLIFFEIIFILKGFKGNRINFSKNNEMDDNTPYPYFFLLKIKRSLKVLDFKKFIDLGCGSGRVINFFNKSFPNKSFVGIEYFPKPYNYCRKIFEKNSNIEILRDDFRKIDLIKIDADCYFFNNPWRNEIEPLDFIINMSQLFTNKSIFIILANYSEKFCERLNKNLKNSQCIDKFFIKFNKGYYIFKINSKK